MKCYRLFYKETDIEFLIGLFSTKEDAERWKDFLAFCIQEFPFDNMYVESTWGCPKRNGQP